MRLLPAILITLMGCLACYTTYIRGYHDAMQAAVAMCGKAIMETADAGVAECKKALAEKVSQLQK